MTKLTESETTAFVSLLRKAMSELGISDALALSGHLTLAGASMPVRTLRDWLSLNVARIPASRATALVRALEHWADEWLVEAVDRTALCELAQLLNRHGRDTQLEQKLREAFRAAGIRATQRAVNACRVAGVLPSVTP